MSFHQASDQGVEDRAGKDEADKKRDLAKRGDKDPRDDVQAINFKIVDEAFDQRGEGERPSFRAIGVDAEQLADVVVAAECCCADLPREGEQETPACDDARFFPFFVQDEKEHARADEQDARAANVVRGDDGECCEGELGVGRFGVVGAMQQKKCQERKGQEGDFGHDLVRKIQQRRRDEAQRADAQGHGRAGKATDEEIGEGD